MIRLCLFEDFQQAGIDYDVIRKGGNIQYINKSSGDRIGQLQLDIKGSACQLVGINIFPSYQSKGFFKILIEEVISYAKENISSFLGIPLNDLTYNQNYLFSTAVRNLNVLTNSDSEPPNLSLDSTILDLVKWYDIQHSLIISKRNQSK